MEKEFQTSIVHHERFREGECFADKASQTLSERMVPAFKHAPFPRSLSPRRSAALLGVPLDTHVALDFPCFVFSMLGRDSFASR